MDNASIAELNSIKSELRSIIKELESISAGVRNDFIGIGNGRCADSIDAVISNYYKVLRSLNKIDTKG